MNHEEPRSTSPPSDAPASDQAAAPAAGAAAGPEPSGHEAPAQQSAPPSDERKRLRTRRIRWASAAAVACALPVIVDPIRAALSGDERTPDLAWDVGRTLGTMVLAAWIIVEIVRWSRQALRRAPGATLTFRDPELVRRVLAERDLPCPRCAYNLRGVKRDRCPECGELLVLGVGAIDPWRKALPFMVVVGWLMVVAGALRALGHGRAIAWGWPQGTGVALVQPTWWGGWPWQTSLLIEMIFSLLPVAVLLPLLVRVMVAGPDTANQRAYRLMQGMLIVLLILALGPWARGLVSG